MTRLGAQTRMLPVVRGFRTMTVEDFLAGIEDGQYSWTWAASDARRRIAARTLRAWLVQRFGDLGRPVEPEFAAEWWAFDLPGSVRPAGRRMPIHGEIGRVRSRR